MKESIKKLIQKEIEAISNIPLDNNYKGAVDLIKGCNKLVTSGMGKAGQIALNILQSKGHLISDEEISKISFLKNANKKNFIKFFKKLNKLN